MLIADIIEFVHVSGRHSITTSLTQLVSISVTHNICQTTTRYLLRILYETLR